MAGVLQGEVFPEINVGLLERVEQLVEAACDYSSQTVFFPVRHHSPACSMHLKRVIAEYRPDCILAEGPSDANGLIDVLTDSKAPVAIYCSFSDKKGEISEDKTDYKCYYPFLDCSPELVALREAAALGIKSEFIDLAYCDILRSQKEGRGLRRNDASYNDDYLIMRSSYISKLCQQLGMRSFDELWEKYFEISAFEQETKQFMRSLLTYCLISRDDTSPEELAEEGCHARENCMARHIIEAKKEYNRILVVTGGFHTCVLPELAAQDDIKAEKKTKNTQQLYPIAYSYEAADMLSGYASGMPAPGFYSKVWDKMQMGEALGDAYSSTVLDFLVSTARVLRGKGETVSAYDEMCAYDMAIGLASLRGKKAPGLYELRDSVLSCYVKGEHNISSDRPIQVLHELATGSKVGKLCGSASVPPIILDFQEQTKRLGLKSGISVAKEVTLEIFSSAKHRQTVAFFHRMCFLDIPYASCVRGIDLRTGRNRNLVREVWKYKWSAQTQSQLIDRSVSGSTVEEAAERILAERLKKAECAQDGASLLVSAFEMGLESGKESITNVLCGLIAADGSFISLANALGLLVRLTERAELYRVEDSDMLEKLVRVLGYKLITLIPSVADVSDDDCRECADACRLLYRICSDRTLDICRGELLEAFEDLVSRRPINPVIEGTVHGLLYGSDAQWREEIMKTSEGYFSGSGEETRKSIAYMCGLFSTSRDLVLADGYFIRAVDKMISDADDERFMSFLPELRLAFGSFTPAEIDRIAGAAAELHGAKTDDITMGEQVLPELYSYGKKLDEWASAQVEVTSFDG